MWRLHHPPWTFPSSVTVATNPRRPPGRYDGCPSYAHRAAGVHQARVPHLVGAPCGTTALASPHRLMPVLVPAVVPLVPSNKANDSSLDGGASLHNRHYAYRHPVYTTKLAHEQDGLLVVATPAYQTAYQSVRPGPITQVLRRTLATLNAAVQRGRILADTEEVTGSNPVSPTSITPGQDGLCDSLDACAASMS